MNRDGYGGATSSGDNAARVVFDATPLQTEHRYRGIGSYTAGLLDALLRLPHQVPLSLLVHPPDPDDLPLLAGLKMDLNVRVLPVGRSPWRASRLQWLFGSVRSRQALRWARAPIYHAPDPHGLVTLPGVATIATLYDLIPLHQADARSSLFMADERIGYARYLRRLRRATHLIAISEATKYDAVERLGIPPERITVTPLAVDERRFYPRSEEEIGRALQRHNLRQPYFLHVGSPDHHKNTTNILRAFDLFCQTGGSDHALYIPGKWIPRAQSSLRGSHRRLVETGRLRLLGFIPDDDLPALYSGADALIYPSLVEGFGLPVLEAMRCGTPVLTSNRSSLPEVGGDAALYVDPLNVEEIAAGLHRLASQPEMRAEMRERGLKRAASFSWTRTAEETLRVYQDCL